MALVRLRSYVFEVDRLLRWLALLVAPVEPIPQYEEVRFVRRRREYSESPSPVEPPFRNTRREVAPPPYYSSEYSAAPSRAATPI
jgi:hypothetical protein